MASSRNLIAATQNGGLENNLINGSITIVQEKCKALILKLTSSARLKPEEDIDQIINQLGDNLTRSVVDSVNSIRDEVKRARPSKDDANYEAKIEVYKSLLEYVTNLMKELTKFFDEWLTNYRERVEKLWSDLQNTSNEEQIRWYTEKFEKDSENIFSRAVEMHLSPYLNAIELKLNFIKK